MFFHSVSRNIKRWTSLFNRKLNTNCEPQIILLLGFIIVIIVQLLLYVVLSSQSIYCQLPTLRELHLQRQSRDYDNYEKLPTIYVITPTYSRYVQEAELTRLSHTFLLVPNLHWIIVEDSNFATELVGKFVSKLNDIYKFTSVTRLRARTPEQYRFKKGDVSWKHPKGIWQRNKALEWLRNQAIDLDNQDGVVYFADDDNTYDLQLFQEMRFTRKVSVWPVGLVGGLLVEKPLLGADNKVESFNSMWEDKRPFPIDMAGFAVSLRLLISNPFAKFSATQRIGYVESHFLNQLVKSWSELEPRADNCNKVLVWHTRTQQPVLHEERKLRRLTSPKT